MASFEKPRRRNYPGRVAKTISTDASCEITESKRKLKALWVDQRRHEKESPRNIPHGMNSTPSSRSSIAPRPVSTRQLRRAVTRDELLHLSRPTDSRYGDAVLMSYLAPDMPDINRITAFASSPYVDHSLQDTETGLKLEKDNSVDGHRRNNLNNAAREISDKAQVYSDWSVPEQRDFPKLLAHFGGDFEGISNYMKTKTPLEVRNHYNHCNHRSSSRNEFERLVTVAEMKKARGEPTGPLPNLTVDRKRRYEATPSSIVPRSDATLHKRPLFPADKPLPSLAPHVIKPRPPSRTAPYNIGSYNQSFPRLDTTSTGEPPRKRGRPSKAESERLKAAAKARGEIYPPPRRANPNHITMPPSSNSPAGPYPVPAASGPKLHPFWRPEASEP